MLRLSPAGYKCLFQDPVLETSFCGAEANVAVALSMYGKDTSFVTALPDNKVGRAARMELRKFGVGVSDIATGGERLGIFFAEKGASQRPSDVIYDRKNSAIACASPEDFDWERIFDGADWFHFTGITPALSPQLAEICRHAAETAHSKGVTVSCDINYRGKLWNQQEACRVMTGIMPCVDVCIGNEEDAYKVFGIKAGETNVENGFIDRNGTERSARELSEKFGCRFVSFSQRLSYSASRNGWFGALYSAADDAMYFSKEYDIDLVDRIGGGDAFAAGLIYGLHSGMCGQDAVEFAAASGCLDQTIEGDFCRFGAEEVRSLAAGNANGRINR